MFGIHTCIMPNTTNTPLFLLVGALAAFAQQLQYSELVHSSESQMLGVE